MSHPAFVLTCRAVGARLDAELDTVFNAVTATFDGLVDDADLRSVSIVHIVPLLGDLVVLVRTRDHGWELPGGTREPGESIRDCICRELREEIGAELRTFRTVGMWRCTSTALKPFRPHIPHPNFNVLLGVGEVDVLREPSGWTGAELHQEIAILPVDQAIVRLMASEESKPHGAVLRRAGRQLTRGRPIADNDG